MIIVIKMYFYKITLFIKISFNQVTSKCRMGFLDNICIKRFKTEKMKNGHQHHIINIRISLGIKYQFEQTYFKF